MSKASDCVSITRNRENRHRHDQDDLVVAMTYDCTRISLYLERRVYGVIERYTFTVYSAELPDFASEDMNMYNFYAR